MRTLVQFYMFCRAVNPYFRLVELGGDTPHQEVPGGVPPLGREADNGEVSTELSR